MVPVQLLLVLALADPGTEAREAPAPERSESVTPIEAPSFPKADGRKSVALMDFATPGFPKSDATLVSSTLVSVVTAEISKLNLRVISKADIVAMLSFEEMKFALACEEGASCLAEIGGALGTDLMLSGTVAKLGSRFTLSMTLIDIETAQIVNRFSGDAGSIDVLPDTARRGVAILFKRAVDSSGTGTLFIKTLPPGADVFVDGKSVGMSPVTLDDVPAGDHEISARMGGLSVKKNVLVEAQSLAKLSLDLAETPPVALKVLSSPPEAQVFLDGELVGETPLILKEVAAGEHELRLKLGAYADETKKIVLSFDEWDRGGRAPLKHEFELALAAVPLVVHGLVPGATVYVDAAPDIKELSPGPHKITVTAPGFVPVIVNLTAEPGTPAKLDVEMKHTEAYADYLSSTSTSRALVSTGAWVGGVSAGLGAAGLVGAFVLNGVAEQGYEFYLDATDPDFIARNYESVTIFSTAAQITELSSYALLGVAALGASVAVVAAVTSPANPLEAE